MKTLKRALAVAATLAFTATGFSISSPFFINFDFDAGASPTVTDPAGAFASVSDFTGGTLDADSMNATLTPATPANFSFDFSLNSPYTASIFSIGYNAVFEGQLGAVTSVFFEADSLNGGILLPSSPASVAFLTPLAGITSGTISFQALGLGGGEVSLLDFAVFGNVAVSEKPATVPDSNTTLLGAFALLGLVALRRARR